MSSPIPATPAPTNPYNIRPTPHGGAIPKVNANADAQAYFNQQSAEDQAKIRESWGGRPAPPPTGGGLNNGVRNMLYNNYQNSYMNQWYNNARNAGSPVPVAPPAAPAAPAAPQPYATNVAPAQPAPSSAPGQPGQQRDNNGRTEYWNGTTWQATPGQTHRDSNPRPQPGGPSAVTNMLTNNYQPPAAPAAPRNIDDEYEAWKAGGRQGPRPEGT